MTKRIASGIFRGIVLLALAGPAWAQAEKLGIGDAIHVTVFQQPDLTTDTRINEKGSIAMPLIGEVKVAGKSQAEAAAQIAKSLKDGKFLKNPQVAVAITTVRSRQVSVLGAVARPGRYPLDDTSSQLSDVIAAAGGISAIGGDTVLVIRDGKAARRCTSSAPRCSTSTARWRAPAPTASSPT